MKIAIVGAGGIGSCLGAALSRVADVTLLCRGAHLAAIQQHGLRVEGPMGVTVHHVHATDRPSAVGPVDVIVSCVKLYDLDEVTRASSPMMGDHTFVVPAQNGVTAQEQIAAIVGAERVLGGTVFMSASTVEPGLVKLRSATSSMTFGELHGGPSRRVSAFAELCESAGIRAQMPDDILVFLWRKFIGLGGAAALSCISRNSLGDIRSDPPLRKLLQEAMAEVLSLAQAKDIKIDRSFLIDAMAFADSVAPDTKVSILEDMEAGKPLELEWIAGYIARESAAAGLRAPINEMAYACTRHLADGSRVRTAPKALPAPTAELKTSGERMSAAHQDESRQRAIKCAKNSTTSGIEHAFVDVGGVRTSYYTAGDRKSTPVLLLHDGAWGADAMLSWREVMLNLATDHHVVAPDLPGFGRTDKVVMFGASPFEHRLRHIAGFLQLLQLKESAHVVGTSFGGSLALRAAAASAWPIASATSVAGTGGPWRVELAKRLLAELEPGRDYIARVVEVLTNQTSGLDEQIDRRYENSLAPGHYAAMVSLRLKHPSSAPTVVEDNFPASLADATVPVSVITMGQDQLVEPDWPKHVRPVAPNVAFHHMDGPHSPNISHPNELSDKLREIFWTHMQTRTATR